MGTYPSSARPRIRGYQLSRWPIEHDPFGIPGAYKLQAVNRVGQIHLLGIRRQLPRRKSIIELQNKVFYAGASEFHNSSPKIAPIVAIVLPGAARRPTILKRCELDT